MGKEEYLLKLSMIEQQSNQLSQQYMAVEQKIIELEATNANLDYIKETPEKEILAQVGNGIFVKSELKEKKLLVNLGSKIIVEKDVEETKKIVEKQIKELENMKKMLEKHIEELGRQLNELVIKAQEEEESGMKKVEHKIEEAVKKGD